MLLFNEEIVAILNRYFEEEDEFVQSIQLATWSLNIQFNNFSICCNARVFASIEGKEYEWDDAPNLGPWGALCRQIPKKSMLKSPNLLTVDFISGDSIDFESEEGPYESVIFDFSHKQDTLIMEVF